MGIWLRCHLNKTRRELRQMTNPGCGQYVRAYGRIAFEMSQFWQLILSIARSSAVNRCWGGCTTRGNTIEPITLAIYNAVPANITPNGLNQQGINPQQISPSWWRWKTRDLEGCRPTKPTTELWLCPFDAVKFTFPYNYRFLLIIILVTTYIA